MPVILEANGNSDISLLQVHEGLLAEPRIRNFYRAAFCSMFESQEVICRLSYRWDRICRCPSD